MEKRHYYSLVNNCSHVLEVLYNKFATELCVCICVCVCVTVSPGHVVPCCDYEIYCHAGDIGLVSLRLKGNDESLFHFMAQWKTKIQILIESIFLHCFLCHCSVKSEDCVIFSFHYNQLFLGITTFNLFY